MSEWKEVYIKNDGERLEYQRNISFKTHHVESWNHDHNRWQIEQVPFLIGGYYRYKKKEDENLDYEFFKDMPPMQITDKSESYISDVILRAKDYLWHGKKESYYKWLAENEYKWRVLMLKVGDYNDETGLYLNNPRLEWSEWKAFKKENYE